MIGAITAVSGRVAGRTTGRAGARTGRILIGVLVAVTITAAVGAGVGPVAATGGGATPAAGAGQVASGSGATPTGPTGGAVRTGSAQVRTASAPGGNVTDRTVSTTTGLGQTVEVASLGFARGGEVESVAVDLSGASARNLTPGDVDTVTVELTSGGSTVARMQESYDSFPTRASFGANVRGIDAVRVLATVSSEAEDGDRIDARVALSTANGTGTGAIDTDGTQSVAARTNSFLRGEVTRRDGTPLANASADIVDTDTGAVATTVTTDANGEFGPLRFSPGNYTIDVPDPLFRTFATRVRLDPGESESISVTVEEKRYADRLTVTPGVRNGTAGDPVSFEVSVLDQSGLPLEGATVTATPETGGQSVTLGTTVLTTDADGTARFNVSASTVSVADIRFSAANLTGGPDPTGTARVRFGLRGDGRVQGRVVDGATTDGLANARVWAVLDDRYRANQRFVRLQVDDDDDTVWVRLVEDATGAVLDDDAYDVRNEEYNRSGAGLSDPDNDTGVRSVEAFDEGNATVGGGVAVVDTDGDGLVAFSVAPLAAADYRIEVSEDAHNASRQGLRDDAAAQFRAISGFDANGTATAFGGQPVVFNSSENLTLAATRNLSRVAGSDPVDAPGYVNSAGVDTGGTDETGGFALSNLYTDFQAGRGYVLFASKPGYSTDVADVFVEADGDTKLTVDSRDGEALMLEPEGATNRSLAPTAAFTRSRTTVPTGQPVTFDASPSLDRDGSILGYAWRFDDGTTASGRRVTHTFGDDSDLGWYDVTLLVVDDAGRTTSVSKPVLVENRSPFANINVSTSQPAVGRPVTFDGANSTDPDGSIVAYEWEIGTGPNATTATGPSATTTFRANGTRTVRLTVTDDDGVRAQTTRTVTVTGQADSNPFPNGIPGGTTERPPTDTDGDGRYEDLTGDGEFAFTDVIEFVFAIDQLQSAPLSDAQVSALDHNADGAVDFVDVIDLVFGL
jgi:PKD repeat protein/protocatechuate 3,4-dioxygenase beta subunit